MRYILTINLIYEIYSIYWFKYNLEAEVGHNISRRKFFRLRIFIQNLIAERI